MSTVQRVQRVVRAPAATIADATSGSFTFLHPITPDANPALRGTKQRLGVSPSEPLGVQSITPTLPLDDRSGYASLVFDAVWLLATVFLEKVELVDGNGAVLETVLSDVGGVIPMSVVGNQALLTRLVINAKEGVKVTLRNTSGGAIGPASGTAKFDLGINPSMVNNEYSV